MSTRKYASGYEKLLKRRRIEKLVESQKGALDKFVTCSKKDRDLSEGLVIEQEQQSAPKELEKDEENNVEEENLKETGIDSGTANLRDLLVEKGSIREYVVAYPKDENLRHFSNTFYVKILPNREKHDRKWLIYSKDFDRVYFFCCKLFNISCRKTQLSDEGSRDWKNLSAKLKRRETTNEHITNMNAWLI
ncbi:TTF-type domain-containing protein [Citrus sinensis]|uniref:TTF-type domain-containing protein n=1 Tax=Citrus sinensis TaxID=2711 RepID=A0ACB8JQ03_CITSI|nr:TTF-type domain-containing protein [Citrus sinensis]